MIMIMMIMILITSLDQNMNDNDYYLEPGVTPTVGSLRIPRGNTPPAIVILIDHS